MNRIAEADGKMVVMPAGPDAKQMGEALDQAAKMSVGKALTGEEVEQWTIRAAEAIATVATNGSKVYDVQRSVDALVTVLSGSDSVAARKAAANALSRIDGAKAQRGLTNTASDASAVAKVRLAAFDDAVDSVRRQGNLASEAQTAKVVEIVNSNADLPIRRAAAKLLGAMNLPSERVKGLILMADR
jgi:hypothetical protein